MRKVKRKDGDGYDLICRKGYPVGSRTGATKCPKCSLFRKSKDKGCIMSSASAKALGAMNNILDKYF